MLVSLNISGPGPLNSVPDDTLEQQQQIPHVNFIIHS